MSFESKRSKEQHVGVRLPPYIYHALTELAKKHEVSLSVVIRALLMRALEEIIGNEDYDRESI